MNIQRGGRHSKAGNSSITSSGEPLRGHASIASASTRDVLLLLLLLLLL
jgi:hypothetical protein